MRRGATMANDLEASEPDDDGIGTPLCPKCLTELGPSVDFCPSCRAPVTSYANTGYLESALAEGWGVGEAVVTKAPSLAIVIGLWLLLSPLLVGLTFALVGLTGARWAGTEVLEAVVTAGLLCGVAWCLFRGTRNYVRTRRGLGIPEPEDGETRPE